jgi:hypothetical protein
MMIAHSHPQPAQAQVSAPGVLLADPPRGYRRGRSTRI